MVFMPVIGVRLA